MEGLTMAKWGIELHRAGLYVIFSSIVKTSVEQNYVKSIFMKDEYE